MSEYVWPEWMRRHVCDGCGGYSTHSLCDDCSLAVILAREAAKAGEVLDYWGWATGGDDGTTAYDAAKRRLLSAAAA